MNRPSKKISRRTKVIYTAMLNFSYFTYGIGFNLLGTSMQDMKCLLHTDLTSVSYGLSIRSVFYSISSLVCIWSFNRFNRQVQLALAFIFLGISLSLTPLSQNVSQYFVCSSVMGFVGAAIDIACNVWMLELWQENYHRYMQALNFFANLGTCLAPVINDPFLAHRPNLDEIVIDDTPKVPSSLPLPPTPPRQSSSSSSTSILGGGGINISDLLNNLTSPREPDPNRSQIEIPHAFIGVTLFITGILINLLYLCVPYTSINSRTHKRSDDPLAEPIESVTIPARVQRSHYWFVMVIGSIIPCFYFSLCMNNNMFMQTFAIENGFEKSTATFMSLVYSAVVAFACLCFMLLSTVLSPQVIIYIELAILLLADCILLYLCESSPTMIWLGVCLLGCGISSIYPSLYSFIKQRIEVNNKVGSLVVFSGSLISITFPILEGKYLQTYSSTFPLINLFSTVCILILFTLMHAADFHYGFPIKTFGDSRTTIEPGVRITDFSTTSVNDLSPTTSSSQQ